MRLNLLLGHSVSKVALPIVGIYEAKISHSFKFERMSTLKANAADHSFHFSSM
jgi:hypothetical protein